MRVPQFNSAPREEGLPSIAAESSYVLLPTFCAQCSNAPPPLTAIKEVLVVLSLADFNEEWAAIGRS